MNDNSIVRLAAIIGCIYLVMSGHWIFGLILLLLVF